MPLLIVGLLIGPRGNTLKKMESESGAKIAIRGKGSVKEGKGRSDAAHASNQEEDLHCLIMADTEEKVNAAKDLINKIIETAASIPEGQNELKRKQLRELAELNGTLRDDENQACQNCKCLFPPPQSHYCSYLSAGGEIGHRKYDCPQQRNYTSSIICRTCGNSGHMARDCPDRAPGGGWRNDQRGGQGRLPPNRDTKAVEFDSLMAQLGGSGPNGGPPARIEGGPGGPGGFDNAPAQDSVPPWQRGATGAPAPWSRNRDDRDGPSGSSQPPWGGNRGNGSYNNDQQPGGYGHSQSTPSAAPWQTSQQQQGSYGGYNNNNNNNYGDQSGGYNHGNYDQGAYGQTGGNAPPWGSAAPPAAPSDVPPPPPPQDDAPPPPPM